MTQEVEFSLDWWDNAHRERGGEREWVITVTLKAHDAILQSTWGRGGIIHGDETHRPKHGNSTVALQLSQSFFIQIQIDWVLSRSWWEHVWQVNMTSIPCQLQTYQQLCITCCWGIVSWRMWGCLCLMKMRQVVAVILPYSYSEFFSAYECKINKKERRKIIFAEYIPIPLLLTHTKLKLIWGQDHSSHNITSIRSLSASSSQVLNSK